MDKTEIKNTCHSIENRCKIVAFVIEYASNPFASEVLPTLLEDNFQDSQALAMNHCIDDGRR